MAMIYLFFLNYSFIFSELFPSQERFLGWQVELISKQHVSMVNTKKVRENSIHLAALAS